jgi:hypothetical protein
MDDMTITILDDGTLKIETDRISAANHMTAEAFLRNVSSVCGAPAKRRHKQGHIGAAAHALRHTLGHKH